MQLTRLQLLCEVNSLQLFAVILDVALYSMLNGMFTATKLEETCYLQFHYKLNWVIDTHIPLYENQCLSWRWFNCSAAFLSCVQVAAVRYQSTEQPWTGCLRQKSKRQVSSYLALADDICWNLQRWIQHCKVPRKYPMTDWQTYSTVSQISCKWKGTTLL